VSGPCLSSSVAGRPLRPATRRSLGEPLPHQQADRPRAPLKAPGCPGFGFTTTCGINSPFGELSPTLRQIAHVLRTRSPLAQFCIATKPSSFDLHVLSTPPAFVLSQNQTLRRKFYLSWQPAKPATSDKNSDQKSILASFFRQIARSRASFVGH
jgi:hypothetical protein